MENVPGDHHIINEKEECTMCKFVLIFSVVVLLLVALFVFFVRLQPPPPVVPLSTAFAPALTPSEWNAHLLELERTASGSAPNAGGKL